MCVLLLLLLVVGVFLLAFCLLFILLFPLLYYFYFILYILNLHISFITFDDRLTFLSLFVCLLSVSLSVCLSVCPALPSPSVFPLPPVLLCVAETFTELLKNNENPWEHQDADGLSNMTRSGTLLPTRSGNDQAPITVPATLGHTSWRETITAQAPVTVATPFGLYMYVCATHLLDWIEGKGFRNEIRTYPPVHRVNVQCRVTD